MCTLYSGGLKEYIAFRNRPESSLAVERRCRLKRAASIQRAPPPLGSKSPTFKTTSEGERRSLQPCGLIDREQENHPYKLWLYESDRCLVFEKQKGSSSLSRGDEWYSNQKNSSTIPSSKP
ncbi:hypothetical protein AVEN_213745-1 [Araneus ventricosus]|uniref:Uncharacterized protein n=1 Tax=Araneus ventricosus TaxID=182803 RepID=A0A4Y2RQD8_ARAVE|nr:hypothetical protein AVEN_213745-1 [Araneus ventricosus]